MKFMYNLKYKITIIFKLFELRISYERESKRVLKNLLN